MRIWQSAYREMLRPGVVALSMTTVAAFVVLYTVIGAAGTHATLDWPQRLALWGIASILCFPVCYANSVMALYLLGSRPLGQILLAVTVVTGVSALPSTAVIYTLDRILWPGYPSHDLTVLYLWTFPPMVLGSMFVLFLISRPGSHRRHIEAATDTSPGQDDGVSAALPQQGPPAVATPASQPQPDSPFFARLPTRLGRDLIFLKMNDHYVEAFTSAGRGIILMRFADAVAELAGVGMQVHRSHWVSFRHVVSLVRDRHRRFLELTGGHKVRVSRTYLPAVRLAIERLEAEIHTRRERWKSGKMNPDPARVKTTEDKPPRSPQPSPSTKPPQRQSATAEDVPALSHFLYAGGGDSRAAAPEPDQPAPRSR